MLNIRKIRLAAGMSQKECAAYLGISRSQLSLAETHRSTLPLQALLRLHELDELGRQMPEMPGSLPGHTEVENALVMLRKRYAFCMRQAIRLRRALKKMCSEHMRFSRRQRLYAATGSDMAAYPRNGRKKEQQKLKNTGFMAQQRLEFRAACMEAHANIAAKMIEQLELRLYGPNHRP